MTDFHEEPVSAKPRYVCNSCGFATDTRVIIKDHAAVLGHFGWTDRVQMQGKRIRLTRLDPEGRPIGEPFNTEGVVEFLETPRTSEEQATARIVRGESLHSGALHRFTVGMDLSGVDPKVLALLFGLKPRPWWWRFTPRFIKHKIKRREIRRGYGG